MVLALSQVVQTYNMRSEHSLFKIEISTNHKLNWELLSKNKHDFQFSGTYIYCFSTCHNAATGSPTTEL